MVKRKKADDDFDIDPTEDDYETAPRGSVSPADMLTADKVAAVRFHQARMGYAFPQVETFVGQVRGTLEYLEAVGHQRDKELHETREELQDSIERVQNLQRTIEVFRAQGDPVRTEDGGYLTESRVAGAEDERLTALNNMVTSLHAELEEKNQQLAAQAAALNTAGANDTVVAALTAERDAALAAAAAAQAEAETYRVAENELRRYVDESLMPWIQAQQEAMDAAEMTIPAEHEPMPTPPVVAPTIEETTDFQEVAPTEVVQDFDEFDVQDEPLAPEIEMVPVEVVAPDVIATEAEAEMVPTEFDAPVVEEPTAYPEAPMDPNVDAESVAEPTWAAVRDIAIAHVQDQIPDALTHAVREGVAVAVAGVVAQAVPESAYDPVLEAILEAAETPLAETVEAALAEPFMDGVRDEFVNSLMPLLVEELSLLLDEAVVYASQSGVGFDPAGFAYQQSGEIGSLVLANLHLALTEPVTQPVVDVVVQTLEPTIADIIEFAGTVMESGPDTVAADPNPDVPDTDFEDDGPAPMALGGDGWEDAPTLMPEANAAAIAPAFEESHIPVTPPPGPAMDVGTGRKRRNRRKILSDSPEVAQLADLSQEDLLLDDTDEDYETPKHVPNLLATAPEVAALENPDQQ